MQVQIDSNQKNFVITNNDNNRMGQYSGKESNLGNQVNTLKSKKQIQFDNWTLLQTPQVDMTQMGSFGIFKNEVTDQIAQVYTLTFNSKSSYEIYLQQFDYWRSQSHPNIVETKYIITQDESSSKINNLCSNFYLVKLFVENPAISLSEIKDIPPAESFFVLFSCLVGFQYLFGLFGYFPIKEQMIMINDNGCIKVWMNADLSRNRPSSTNDQVITLDQYNPQAFIKELVQLIHKNTDYLGLQHTFKRYLEKKTSKQRGLTFKNCRKLLLEFAEQQKFDLPESLAAILDILFEKTSQTSISRNNLSINNDHILYGRNYQHNYLLGEENNQTNNQTNEPITEFHNPGSNQSNPYIYRQDSVSDIRSFEQFPRNLQPSNNLHMPKATIKYENSSPRNTDSLARSPVKQNSMHDVYHSQQYNDHHLQSNNHTISMPKMMFSYNNQFQGQNNQRDIYSQDQQNIYNQDQENNYYQNQQDIYNQNKQGTHNRNQETNYCQDQQKIQYQNQERDYYQNQQNIYYQDQSQQNLKHEYNKIVSDLNAYQSLLQRQIYEKQSTIREQPQQESFFTSIRNSKFQTSKDVRRTSAQIKNKNLRNGNQIKGHKQTFSSLSGDTNQNEQPIHLSIKEEQRNFNKYNQISARSNMSSKSIQFHTPNDVRELDSQIAKDLQEMMSSIKV